MFNTNATHNLLNLLIALIAGLDTFLVATGCVLLPGGALECSHTWLGINPAWLGGAISALAVIKLVINAARDGLAGMAKAQPPVADQIKTVVVTSPADTSVSVSAPGSGAVIMPPKT